MIGPVHAAVILVAPCSARDIHPFNGMLQGATGTMDGSVFLRNLSPHRCRLGGRPAVRIRTRAGQIFATKQEAFAAGGGRSVTALAPRGTAALHLDWSNWCGAWTGRLGRFVTVYLQVMLASGPTLEVPVQTGRPRCDESSAPSRLFVSKFVTS